MQPHDYIECIDSLKKYNIQAPLVQEFLEKQLDDAAAMSIQTQLTKMESQVAALQTILWRLRNK